MDFIILPVVVVVVARPRLPMKSLSWQLMTNLSLLLTHWRPFASETVYATAVEVLLSPELNHVG